MTSLQAVATDSSNTLDDAFSKVMGREKRGYIRCIGKMPYVKNTTGASSSTGSNTMEQKLARTEGVVKALVHLFSEHIPNANLSNILNSMNIKISDKSMDQSNTHDVN